MHRTRILLVEDDEDLASCLQAVLEEDRYEVVSVGDGRQALEVCRGERSPSLVLVDLNIPGQPSGAELVTALRDCLPAGTRLILVSAARDLERRAAEMGVDGWLEKPFGIETLLQLVEAQSGGALSPAP